ncbi:ephrin type-A receptor 4a-like [Planococcus citri]|uniref:ephrin type-A receptor 4a-like n=1 Tax=Planococcus citri TaxID=170843 RepID=UPI0031F83EC7
MLILGNSDVPHLDFIGKGGFGNVHLGCFGGQTLAFKYASKLQENDEQLLNEVEIMQNLNHPHILKLIGKVIADDGSSLVAVIFEFMRYGDLWNMIRKPNYVLSQVILTRMCRDIASGMEYLAENGIVHRDLACRNCLVDSAFTIKIADFGLSGYADENGIYQQQGDLRAAARWMAPECIDLAFSEKSDVWAYGIVLWEIYSGGRRPYDDMHLSDANKFVQDGGTLEIENEDCPEHIKRISESCWRWDPEERPSFSQILRLFQPATSL